MMLNHNVSILVLVAFQCFLLIHSQNNNRGLFIRGKRPLPIDGQWNSWAPWSVCYQNRKNVPNFYPPLENYFIQSRNRTCDNPKPINGGDECLPPSHRFKQCTCMNPLGMGTRLVNDSQITASSYQSGYPPNEGRLGNGFKGWCSKYKVSLFRKSYLEIDFKGFANVGAISIVNNEKGRIIYFKAEYSLNGKKWENITPEDGRKGLFKGNLITGKVATRNFSRHKVMKYLRIIPTKSYSLPCLKAEPIGCTFTCGELHTASFGKISASSRVDLDQNCLWRIEVLNTSALSFDLTVFDILCKYGYLDFHDGSVEFTNSPLLKRLCLGDRDQEIPLLKMNTNMVWLNFVSNSSDIEDSFTLKYFSECKQIIQLDSGEFKTINSPNYPNRYFGNMNCSWIIDILSEQKEVKLIINDFSVESTSGLCSDDVLTIKWYLNDKEKVLGSFCNSRIPQRNYTMKADKIILVFKTDPIHSDKGFSLSVQSKKEILPTIIDSTKKSVVITTPYGLKPEGNNSFIDGVKKKKKERGRSSDWTIIIISAFSAVLVVLLIWVIGMNIRRFIKNRNEVEAHCKKVKAKNEEKLLQEKKKNLEKTALMGSPNGNQVQVLLSPKLSAPVSPSRSLNENDSLRKKTCTEEEIDDCVDDESLHFLTPPANKEDNKNDKQIEKEQVQSPCAEIDTPLDYESSSIQIHSPLKTSSVSDLSVREGNNNSDIESCV